MENITPLYLIGSWLCSGLPSTSSDCMRNPITELVEGNLLYNQLLMRYNDVTP